MTGVTYLREKPDLILMHDDSTIAVLDKEKDMPALIRIEREREPC